jgi:hypothetical protein
MSSRYAHDTSATNASRSPADQATRSRSSRYRFRHAGASMTVAVLPVGLGRSPDSHPYTACSDNHECWLLTGRDSA